MVNMVFRELTDVQRRAIQFLKKELSDREKHSFAEILSKSKKGNISYRSLLSAKKILKITVTFDTYERFWSLEI